MKNDKHVDKELKKTLLKQTDIEPDLKEQTWSNIHQELFPSDPSEKITKTRKRWISGLAVTAAILFLSLGIMTDTGQAMLKNLRDMFVDEKQEEIELEGQKEPTDVHLETNEELNYIIYIDEERYQMEEIDGRDRIVTKEPLSDEYPDVYMEIHREEDTTTEETMEAIKSDIEAEGLEISNEERVDNPIEAEIVQGMGGEHGEIGHEWDTPIHRYYVTDEVEGQVFVIKQVYFLEAAEGHGARFDSMLESFEIVRGGN
ncbi:hypothetical protein ACS127_01010 [Amphibacillus sp. Q70]|uniref:hypothetical protein n=1 Tax=Amphibacillus sp. Q70 TaxID=3453416 RepID=UPI003F86F1ED